MTDLPPRDPDQLASDLVDGLLPPDEVARLRGDPEIASRVARIEQLRGALRAAPPPPAGGADRMVAAAVAAARSAGVPQAAPEPGGPVPRHLQPVPPAVPRPQPSRGSSRPWLAAAAAVIFAGLVTAGLVASSGGNDDRDSAAESSGDAPADADAPMASAEEHASGDAGSGDDMSADGENGAAPGEMAPTTPPAQLGTFDDVDALAAGVAGDRMRTAASEDEGGPATSASVESAGACPGLAPAGDTARGVATYVAAAVFDGEAVTVHLYERDGETRLVATTLDCVDVVDVPFDT